MVKRAVLNALVSVDAFRAFRYINRAKTPILMYHRFSAEPTPFTTSREELVEHLSYIKKRFTILSLADYVSTLRNGDEIPSNAAVITIDDGYRDAYDIAFPIFEEFAVPATLFVVTDFLQRRNWIWTDKARYICSGTEADRVDVELAGDLETAELNGEYSRNVAASRINSILKKLDPVKRDEGLAKLAHQLKVELPDIPPERFGPITWDQAREMDRSCVVIGSHTVSHPILTHCSDEVLYRELERSKTVLEGELQREDLAFCYPNGDCSDREAAAARSAGYSCAVSTESRLADGGEDLFLLPRIAAESDISRLAQAVSGFDAAKQIFS